MDVTKISDVSAVRRQTLTAHELLRRLRDPSPPVVGLLVDSEGVLYDDTAWLRWLLQLLTRLGLHTHFTPFFRLWQRDYLARVKWGEWEYWQALREFLGALGLTPGQIDEVEAAAQARHYDLEDRTYPLPGVVNALARLRNLGVELTLFSSGYRTSHGVHAQLSRLGLDTAFHRILVDVELLRDQPNRCPWDLALSLIGIPASQLGYLGRDSQVLADANQAGLRTVAVNYDLDAEADIYIGHFEQLLDALPWATTRAMVG